MTEPQQPGPSAGKRVLQVAAIISALSIVGSYVAWSQYEASERAKLKREAGQALSPEVIELSAEILEFEGFVDYGSPIVTADGLALSSKSISMPIFSTRRAEEGDAPKVLGEGVDVPAEEEARATDRYGDFVPGKNGMISGSKSIGRPLTLPLLSEPEEESPEPDSESP